MPMKAKTVVRVGVAGRQTVGAHDGDGAEIQMRSYCGGCGSCDEWRGSCGGSTLLCGRQASRQKSDLSSVARLEVDRGRYDATEVGHGGSGGRAQRQWRESAWAPGHQGRWGEGARAPVAETLAAVGRGTAAKTLAAEGNDGAQGRR